MKLHLSAAALALAMALPAQAQTQIQWWHSMSGPLGDWVNDLAKDFNASQKEYVVVPTYKGTYGEAFTAAYEGEREVSSLTSGVLPVPYESEIVRLRVKENRVDLADGIRVVDNGGWAQFVPDPDEPLFHIYAEGATDNESVEILGRYRAMLDEVLRSAET